MLTKKTLNFKCRQETKHDMIMQEWTVLMFKRYTWEKIGKKHIMLTKKNPIITASMFLSQMTADE